MSRPPIIDATPPNPPRAHPESLEQLEAHVSATELSSTAGIMRRVVARPAVDRRRVLQVGRLGRQGGLAGDRYVGASGNRQLSLIRWDVALACAAGEPVELSGDNFFVEGLDLSEANLPPGSRLQLGSAVCEVTGTRHAPCDKFAARFGDAAFALTAKDHPRLASQRLRGILLRCVEPGEVETGDTVSVLTTGDD